MSANLFIVPHDFTSVGDAALKYALFLAKPRKTAIKLLHIISSEDKRQNAQNKLDEIIKNLDLSVGSSEVTSKIEKGSIFEDIPKIAEDLDARIIIMGTHGAQGMQKLFGSYAMKVITNSSIPFLVVQDGINYNTLKNIVVPITIDKESLQVINIAGEIAKTFDSKIHVIAEQESDLGMNQQLKVRIALVEKQYEEKGIDATISLLNEKMSFHKAIMKYTKDNQGDMIAVAYYSSSIFPQFEKFTQNLITNEGNVPCLVINSKLLAKYFY